MFAVVGCRDCGALWVIEGRPDTTQCPRCRSRHRVEKLRRFAETTDADAAREARSRLLQARGEADADLDDFASLEPAAMDAGMSDDEYLDAAGLDVDAVTEAGESAAGGSSSSSRREVVLAALRELESPTEDAVREYATEHGVDPDYVGDALAKLRRRGEVSESGGRYRLL